jgi:hypothetical protein
MRWFVNKILQEMIDKYNIVCIINFGSKLYGTNDEFIINTYERVITC